MSEQKSSSLIPDGTEKSSGGVVSHAKKSSWKDKLQSPKLHLPKLRMKVKLPALKEITWGALWHATVEFLADPVNVAVVVWVLLSVPGCILIAAIKLGLLNNVIHDEHEREHIDEVATQVVNALFALMCLIIFPMLIRHTYLLMRWRPADKIELRQAFCKNGKRKPHDRTHIAVVVFWAHVTCWTTFAFSATYWLYPLGKRPVWLVYATFVSSMVAPVIGFLYLLLSPLSKDYDIVKEGDDNMLRMYRRKNAFFDGEKEVVDPQWNGSVFPGCCANRKVACLVCIFPCCMFGFNMERLGFGHRVVHTLAFIVVLVGPLLVFQLSSEALGESLHASNIVYYCGLFLTIIGTAYGGAWRMKMRETYHLPGSTMCCCSKRATDVCTWIWCSYCTLCQEIRTTEQYSVEETASLYAKAPDGEADSPEIVAPEGDDDILHLSPETSPPAVPKMEAGKGKALEIL